MTSRSLETTLMKRERLCQWKITTRGSTEKERNTLFLFRDGGGFGGFYSKLTDIRVLQRNCE